MKNNKIKICYITHLPNLTGANQSLLDILKSLDKNRFDPVVLLGKSGPLEGELKRLGIRYKVIPYSSEISSKNLFVNIIKKIKSRLAIKRIEKFYKDENIQVVHNNSMLSWSGMRAANNLSIPYICHVRDLIWEDHKIKLIHEKEQYVLMNEASKVIFISNFVQTKFSSVNKNELNSTIIFDGIDIEKYLNNHDTILKNSTTNLLLAGRIAPGKGQLDAIKAVSQLNNMKDCGTNIFKLKIVGSIGDKNYYLELKDYVSKHRIENIEFIEFTDLKELRKESDIALMCSSAEALGRVTIESMLSGCLLIGADCGATKEIVKDGESGLLYKCGDIAHLVSRIQYAVQNSDKMNIIAKFGQKYAIETFLNSSYCSELETIYLSLIDKE